MRISLDKLKKYKKYYDENGFVVIRDVISKKNILSARKNLDKFIILNRKSFKGRNINLTKGSNINSVHFMDNWVWSKKFLKNKTIKTLSNCMLGEQSVKFGSELFAKPAKDGLASPMHQDNFYWCVDNSIGLTVWIALDVSNKKNGGVYYFKKSHLKGLLKHKLSYAPGSSQTIKYPSALKNLKKVIPNIKLGDCIIHSCLVVHGSNKNKSKLSRRGLTVRFIGKSSKIDSKRKQVYEKNLNKNFRRGN